MMLVAAMAAAVLHRATVIILFGGRTFVVPSVIRVVSGLRACVVVSMAHLTVVGPGRGPVVVLMPGHVIVVFARPLGLVGGCPRSAISAGCGVRPLGRDVGQFPLCAVEVSGDFFGRRRLVQPDEGSRTRHALPDGVHRRRQIHSGTSAHDEDRRRCRG
ncbi:hypothetical protein [Actinomadura terrae]|uniref:hypothetical protein n=1 Tax=Actinomadura terrae TaxID=604353 RepID=UPI001FA74334|nr:hypothetical protein [Actinomadura terrae]